MKFFFWKLRNQYFILTSFIESKKLKSNCKNNKRFSVNVNTSAGMRKWVFTKLFENSFWKFIEAQKENSRIPGTFKELHKYRIVWNNLNFQRYQKNYKNLMNFRDILGNFSEYNTPKEIHKIKSLKIARWNFGNIEEFSRNCKWQISHQPIDLSAAY
jgi:hypothetical protein